ncbi:TonB-linked outer membrane protein, SusC/RagA family [Dyadobacter koreensis]|uniref:TonB-linked outer membrane protein, SusC/RagA family n=1 Tax=Dyadobacter koreensis TaxID=408657 RepID=A0A1H6RV76_9BACT|nr:SusC/RagA family TonB-linked outer membrane protein [Dyadobacter koreensis]SEI55690.1 TonB-linked outer membrane protein, SusC/RagA family [Dyadobacter koreensis]
MRKILSSLLGCLLLLGTQVYAQDRSLTGKVTAEDGSVLPGVNIAVKGTNRGSTTDAKGEYSLSVSQGSTLVFSFIGFQTQEAVVGSQSVLNVSLKNDVSQLQEVVVTALGQEKKRNELVYAAQQVSAEQLTQTRNPNLMNALSGKLAGVDIKVSNTMGGSTNVVIRGFKSITGNNQALWVIDGVPVSNANNNTTTQQTGGAGVDYGNAASDINPDNIASINVLKGAAASALYGSRASNGVIMVTTKKGRKNSFDVTVNSGVTWGKIDKSTFARYQTEYGQGYVSTFKQANLGAGLGDVAPYDVDASFGPKFDGRPVYQWDAIDKFSPNFGKQTPWVKAENGPASFYETAVTSNQSIALSGGGDASTFKIGYTRSDETGVLPNSSLKKNLFNFGGSYDLNKKLTVAATVNFSNIKGNGRNNTGYNGKNPNQGFRQWWPLSVDIAQQKEAYFRNQQNVTWNWANIQGTNPIFADNPYYTRYKNFSNDTRDHYQGSASATYKIASWVDFTGRFSYDGTIDAQEERISVGSAAVPSYIRFDRNFHETNLDLLFNFRKEITKGISFTGLLGSNMRRSYESSMRASTNGGLAVPNLYSLSNSVSAIEAPTEIVRKIGVDGIFANASFDYKGLVNLDLAARQDKSTTLPKSSNTYFYPSVGANFVFSELPMLKNNWLTLGKLRANYAEVGNDAPWGSIYDVYDKPTGIGTVPYFSLPNTKNNANLKSERTKSYEIGIEAAFLNDRLGFDVTGYKTSTLDQILPVSVTSATGFTARYVNSGEMQNKGIEVSAYITPIKTEDFSWTMNVNYTRNRNKVVSLYGDVTNVQIASLQGGVTINAALETNADGKVIGGLPFGVIRGTNFTYMNGQKVVGTNGIYKPSASSGEIIGNPNPDWLGGVTNTLKYKSIALSFLVDIRQGGNIFSLDQWYGEGSGLYPITAGLNELGIPKRDDVYQRGSDGKYLLDAAGKKIQAANPGGVLFPGVQADGSPNTVRAENIDGNSLSAYGYTSNAPRAMYVYDASYVKLREASISYSLPQALVNKTRAFKEISVSVIGRNLWIIHKNMKYSDPEDGLSSGTSNGAGGYQSGAYPTVRSYGFNVKFRF